MMTIAQCQFYFYNEIDLLFVLSGKNNKLFVNNKKKYIFLLFLFDFLSKNKNNVSYCVQNDIFLSDSICTLLSREPMKRFIRFFRSPQKTRGI